MGIEPTQPAWEAGTLPLSYTRTLFTQKPYTILILGTRFVNDILTGTVILAETRLHFYSLSSR